MKRYYSLLVFILFITSAQAQYTITQKKKQFVLKDKQGAILHKSKDSLFLIHSKSFDRFFISSNGGYRSLWEVKDEKPSLLLEGNFNKIELSAYDSTVLVGLDCFGMRTVIKPNGEITQLRDQYYGRPRGGVDNKGKAALCTPTSNKTAYKYDYVYSMEGRSGLWFVAGTDQGEIVLDSNGTVVLNAPMDKYILSTHRDSLFIARKSDLWSIVDLNNQYQLESKEIRYPWRAFRTDGKSFVDLDNLEVIYIENEKQGVIDMKGKVLVPPIYDAIEKASTYSYNEETEEYTDISKYVVRKDANKNEWQALGMDLKELPYTLFGDQWIGSWLTKGYFTDGAKARIYDFDTGIESSFGESGFDERFVLSGLSGQCLADREGNLILPLGFQRIETIWLNDSTAAYAARKNDVYHLYDAKGKCLTPKDRYDHIGITCIGGGVFLRVASNDLEGILEYDEKQGIKVLFSVEYESISCNSPDDTSRPLAIGKKKGKEYELWHDGRVVAR